MTPEKRQDLIDLVNTLGRERFAPRAAAIDLDARFPFENYDDLREHGLLALCIPESHGGLGAGFEDYCLIAREMGKYCGATALSFNMHTISMLWSGEVCDDLDFTDAERRGHEESRAYWFGRVLAEGLLFAQPFSEPSGDPFASRARRVDGGWLVTGRKHFASLSGAADYYSLTCSEVTEDDKGDGSQDLFLIVPGDADGFTVTGTWDPLGMRGTVSRVLELEGVFVPEQNQLMPKGGFIQAARRWPHMYLTINATYMGIARAAYDFTVAYLRGETPGSSGPPRRSSGTKQRAVADMRLQLDLTDGLWRTVLSEAKVDPTREQRLRMFSAHYAVMEHCNDICQLAIRTCGGRSMMKSLPLERMYRDSRCGSLMLPFTAEVCLERLGYESLYQSGERD
jgi:alkylation response protein AidB-like acyl-CoA dehydrogenase